MKYKGINYDTGMRTTTGKLTREKLEPEVIAKEISIIRHELHCNAIRISGLDIDRIVMASEIALQQNLSVWFSPSLHYENINNTVPYILDAAERAEELRDRYGNLVFVVGCEMTLFTPGFIRGDGWKERVSRMFSPLSILKNQLGLRRNYNKKLNRFLSQLIVKIKKRFHGDITYASGTWEKPDWNLFDYAGVDLYRSFFNKKNFIAEIHRYKKTGKPLVITEFGCCTYKGADDKGAAGWTIVDWNKPKPELKGNFTRDETVQSDYIIDLLNIFDKEEVFAAFVFTFISCNYTWSEDTRYDLDMAAFGITRSMPGNLPGYKNLPWVPKESFFILAEYNKSSSIR